MKKLMPNYTAILALFALIGAIGTLAFLAGCAEVADPAARSNRATYTITLSVGGDGSTGTAYITDGLMATADGEGAITSDAKQTQKPSTEITGGLDPIAAGIGAAAKLGVAAINAASGGKACASGDCGECGSCKGGSCSEGGTCEGGSCGE